MKEKINKNFKNNSISGFFSRKAHDEISNNNMAKVSSSRWLPTSSYLTLPFLLQTQVKIALGTVFGVNCTYY
ncbi:hypothetical protein [Chryseobacterium ureilyticum]|uniref:hypothetical protein n=1 Tax=Chryseobacterium ureilyticum TaxID=373668 RepID=UPI0011158F46|nr:hypothetical protein [Chryseobacterium ureilyticum]